jgi:DNA-binding NarL/FixJ family response regulator
MTRDQANSVHVESHDLMNGTESPSKIDPGSVNIMRVTSSAGVDALQGVQTLGSEDLDVMQVVIVDDDASTRRFLNEVLQQCQQFDVIGEAGDGEAAITMISDLQPDLVVLDLSMPRLDGFGTIDRLRLVAPNVMIIVLSGLGSKAADAVARRGVTAFLPKGIPPLELLDRLGAILGRRLTVDVSTPQAAGASHNRDSSPGPGAPDASRTRAVVCDDDPVVRHSITRLLEANDVVVTAETETSPTLVALVDLVQPELVVLDVWLKGAVDGALIRDICDRSPRSIVIVYSELAKWKARAVAAGAKAFVLKPDFDELTRQLEGLSVSRLT